MLLFYYSHGDFPILSLLHPEIENDGIPSHLKPSSIHIVSCYDVLMIVHSKTPILHGACISKSIHAPHEVGASKHVMS